MSNSKINHTALEYKHAFALESGDVLPGIQIAYHTYGKLNSAKSNVVWACHAFTANSDVCDWWKGLFGIGCLYNPEEHFIVCPNILGSCYGSTGPLTTNPELEKPWYRSFPLITVKDLVKAGLVLGIKLSA